MIDNANIAMVTGGTSGLGFEAAAQLAESGVKEVIVTGRTLEKATAAIRDLVERTDRDVFVPIVIDNDKLDTVEEAAQALVKHGGMIDVLILNAGIAPPPKVSKSADGFERTVSSSLLGHHLLTMRLFEHGLLSQNVNIIIAGSEAATGAVPSFTPVDFHAMADKYFNGDLAKAVRAQMLMEAPAVYNSGDVYAAAKVFVAQWAKELSERFPKGMSIAAVSPGSVPETNAIRNAGFFLKYIMVPVFKFLPGMSHSVADGARRYLDAADRGTEITGEFLASPPKKMVGPLAVMDLPHIKDAQVRKAMWSVTTELTGVGLNVRT